MPTTVKQMLEAANAAVPRVTPMQAREMIAKGRALVVDVRDGGEVQKSGKVAGAINVSRGMLEFRADPESPYHDQRFAKEKTVILYCGSGAGRRSPARRSRIWDMTASTISAPSRTGPRAAAPSTTRNELTSAGRDHLSVISALAPRVA
ncbi:MAG TPA: rhodanese-like domain-containing protein [Stellaceae bacterium]|nr:rhodanese-like domain-containing protein [Stellaceae bacterium]